MILIHNNCKLTDYYKFWQLSLFIISNMLPNINHFSTSMSNFDFLKRGNQLNDIQVNIKSNEE